MALNRTSPRSDLGYLRRRPRRDEAVGEATAAAAASRAAGPRLSLRPPAAAPAPPAAPAVPATGRRRRRRRPASRVTERTILTNESRSVTLNSRQSAIGSLTIDVHRAGSLSCIWELADGTSGVVSQSGGITASPEFGRRPLVQLRRGQVLIGLRHIRELRRLLVVVSGPVPEDRQASVVLTVHDGATVESVHAGTAAAIVSVAGYQVDGELVIRREDRGLGSIGEAAEGYGFAATWTPPPSRGPS